MNTLQLISYFQFLSLYYTVLLSKFLQSLEVANFKINISFIDNAIDDIKDSLIGKNYYDLRNDDEKIQENGIDSSSILRNASGILVILFQGCCCCFIMYAIKAKFVSLPKHTIIKVRENVEKGSSKSEVSESVIDSCRRNIKRRSRHLLPPLLKMIKLMMPSQK
jgi:hypothetical protein